MLKHCTSKASSTYRVVCHKVYEHNFFGSRGLRGPPVLGFASVAGQWPLLTLTFACPKNQEYTHRRTPFKKNIFLLVGIPAYWKRMNWAKSFAYECHHNGWHTETDLTNFFPSESFYLAIYKY